MYCEGLLFKQPKTASGRRVVTLPKVTVKALKDHRKLQAERRMERGPAYEDHGLVFPGEHGHPWHPDTFTSAWRNLASKAGLDSRFHAWRHGHATQLLRDNVHLKIVSARLGHSTIGITADTYSHVTEGMQRSAAAEVDAAFARGLRTSQKPA